MTFDFHLSLRLFGLLPNRISAVIDLFPRKAASVESNKDQVIDFVSGINSSTP